MRRFFALVGLGLVPLLYSGCLGIAYALKDDCEPVECTGGYTTCQGNAVVECSYWEGDPCEHGTLSVTDDCAARGQVCVEDHCEAAPAPPPPSEPCIDGLNGVCRGNVAHQCVDGKLSAGEDCLPLGVPCTMIERNDWVVIPTEDAVCSISTERCASAFEGTECRDNARVTCHRGWPIRIEPCEGENMKCHLTYESGSSPYAECSYSVPCPPNDGRICNDGIVVGCVGTKETVRLRDCNEHGEECVVRDGQSYCAASAVEPARARWLPIAGGTFQPGSGSNRSTVTLAAFEMMEREVTEAEYEACRASGACTKISSDCRAMYDTPFTSAELPVTCIDFSQARAYCASQGGRLPTELEWEYALRNGGAEASFPWGDDDPSCDHTIIDDGCGRNEQWPGCSREDDVTTQGICDLVGNVLEWVETATTPPRAATRGLSFDGAWGPASDLRVSRSVDNETPYYWGGVRCVR